MELLLVYLNLSKLTELVGTIFNLPISNLSTSNFKLGKLIIFANSDVLTLHAHLHQILLYG